MFSSKPARDRSAIRAEIQAAKEDGYELIDTAAIAHELRTKAIIEDLYRGMEPLHVCVNYNISLGDIARRLANYARHQGKMNGEFQ